METLIINYTTREKRFALVRDHKVEKLVMDRPDQHSLVGNIYYGTVTRVLPGMNAAFVEIGEDKSAYLQRRFLVGYVLSSETQNQKEKRSISSFVHQGEKLPVQIVKDATGTKGPKVTGIIEIPGNHLIYMPNGRYVAVSRKIMDAEKNWFLRSLGKKLKEADEGILFRTSSIGCTEAELRDELNQLRARYKEMMNQAVTMKHPGLLIQKETFIGMVTDTIHKMTSGQVIVDDLLFKQQMEVLEPFQSGRLSLSYFHQKENVFSANRVEHEIEKALKRVVWLENGGYLIFDETEALTIVDVNTGKFSGKTDLQDTVLKTNRQAAVEVARQLRLRDLGGMILIDFIDMDREQDQHLILEAFEKELLQDEKRTKIVGFTPLGILQLTRKKTRVSLSEALEEKCPVCEGTGRVISAETQAFRLERELFEHRYSQFEAVLVETTNEVKVIFEGPGKSYQSQFEEAVHFQILFDVQPDAVPFYRIKQAGDVSEIARKADDD